MNGRVRQRTGEQQEDGQCAPGHRDMTSRGTNLLNRDPQTLVRALTHPLQLHTCQLIEEMLTRLRTLRQPIEYYNFQVALFHEIYAAQELQATASANVKRARRGRTVPAALSGSWELELLVLDRAVRQLRSVGDALAWRLFDYDRRYILALSRNDPVSPMVGNVGLGYELSEIQETWNQDHTFALLHDLTNCLRIADMTKFTPEGPRLLEKKKQGQDRVSSTQLQRMQDVIDVINHGAPLKNKDGPLELFVAAQPFKTHLKKLEETVWLADRDGISSIRIGRQWVLSALSTKSLDFKSTSVDEWMSRWTQLRERMFQKAGMQASQHLLRGVRFDQVAYDPAMAPFSIYPFDPETRARLTCDFVSCESVMAWDRLSGALQDEGFTTTCPLPEANVTGESALDPVLIAEAGESRITIHGYGSNQVLFELTDPKAYARAIKEVVARSPQGTHTGVLTFSNEKATWR
jgi:hypothetical protein